MNNSRKYIKWMYAWVMLFMFVSASGQTVTVTPDRYKIFIGEQIKIKISVENVWLGVPWLYVPDSINHLEVVEKTKIDTVKKGGSYNFYQTVSITSFDSGTWKFPSLVLGGVNKTSIPFNVAVLPADVSKLKDYHDIKDIIEVKPGTNWWLIILIALIVLLLTGLLIWYLKKRKKPVQFKAVPKGVPPLEWALQQLDKLKRQPVNTSMELKQYFTALTDISRSFFQDQFNHQPFKKTTDEWMVELQSLKTDNDIKSHFLQVLRLTDVVKFAKYKPSTSEVLSSWDTTKEMITKSAMLDSNTHSKFQPKQS